MKRHRRTIRLVIAALLAAGPASQALAQFKRGPDLAGVTLEDLMNITITTASLTPEGLAGAPARMKVVTAAQIQRRGYRSLADLLKDISDFKVDIAGDPDFPSEVTVQGIRGGTRVVLLLDGVRISSPTNEPLPIVANYPVHNARQIEIVYGPASAVYGADAFSAVVNIISNNVADSPGLSLTTSIGQFGLYGQTGSNLVQDTHADHASGLYHGWPVAVIDHPVNEGRAATYGGRVGLDFVHAVGDDRHFEAHAALSLVDGHEQDQASGARAPIGAMAPVQFRAGVDIDLGGWSLAPRLTVVGAQRTLATAIVDGALVRRTLDGYRTVDMNIRRRHVLKNLDAFLTIENAFDERYRNINIRAFTNPEELSGAPQNPRRLSFGVDLRLP